MSVHVERFYTQKKRSDGNRLVIPPYILVHIHIIVSCCSLTAHTNNNIWTGTKRQRERESDQTLVAPHPTHSLNPYTVPQKHKHKQSVFAPPVQCMIINSHAIHIFIMLTRFTRTTTYQTHFSATHCGGRNINLFALSLSF